MKIAAADWERGKWVVKEPDRLLSLSKEEFLLYNPLADVILVESAHLKERNPYSVAQVYTDDELRALKCRSRIKLFPGNLTWKASEYAGNVIPGSQGATGKPKPDKTKDAESLVAYAEAHPNQLASWKFFTLPDEDKARKLWPYRDALRVEIQETLNPLRYAWNNLKTNEKYNLPVVKLFCELVDKHFDEIPEGVKVQFGIRRSKNGIRVERMSSAITVFLAVYTAEGRLRTRPDGRFIGCRFILKAIGMTHSYKPNMARSQLTWHGMRHYKGTRTEYMRNLRQFITFLRSCYNEG